jgi:hypothetical protein
VLRKGLLAVLVATPLSAPLSASDLGWVGRFSAPGAPPTPWRQMGRGGLRATQYRVTTVAGRIAVQATFDSSMSILARRVAVDLTKTPVLCWSWYIDHPVAKADMTQKSGDDYAARVYIGFDIPDAALSGSTKFKLAIARAFFGKDLPDAALVYVWDNKHPVGTARKSSYNDRTQLIVAETGASRAALWVSERVDLASDFVRAFGNSNGSPVGLAIAADGDNTRSKGRAAFADIHFVGRSENCAA